MSHGQSLVRVVLSPIHNHDLVTVRVTVRGAYGVKPAPTTMPLAYPLPARGSGMVAGRSRTGITTTSWIFQSRSRSASTASSS